MRRILRSAALLLFTTAPFLHVHPVRAQHQAVGDTLRIGLVVPESAVRPDVVEATARGVRMGVDEAARSAALFGRGVVLVEGPDAERLVHRGRVRALVGGFGTGECGAIADVANRLAIPFIAVGCDDDALRGEGCRPTTFHAAPSAAMLRDAVAQAGVADGRAVAWDARLERFGADQLNQRFRARYGVGMDSQGWVGWFAVKVLWESSLRALAPTPSALIGYLRSDAAQFDGHKGRPLSFRTWDRQLRQPLYVVSPTSPAPDEVPRATPADTASRDVLDRLGTTREETECWQDLRRGPGAGAAGDEAAPAMAPVARPAPGE